MRHSCQTHLGLQQVGKSNKGNSQRFLVLPDTSSTQTTPSRSRAATREAMSSSLVSLCELGFSSAWLTLRGFAALRCRDAGVFIPGKWKVKVRFHHADWKSGKVGTCPRLSVFTSTPASSFFFFSLREDRYLGVHWPIFNFFRL